MTSEVTRTHPAASEAAATHFAAKLAFETDCSDVYASLSEGSADFVLLDVRSPESYAKGHVPGAVNLPVGKIIAAKLRAWPADTVFVVYCAGSHCNGADKAAVRLAQLGRPVKLMIGGALGWLDEGYSLIKGDQAGSVLAGAA